MIRDHGAERFASKLMQEFVARFDTISFPKMKPDSFCGTMGQHEYNCTMQTVQFGVGIREIISRADSLERTTREIRWIQDYNADSGKILFHVYVNDVLRLIAETEQAALDIAFENPY